MPGEIKKYKASLFVGVCCMVLKWKQFYPLLSDCVVIASAFGCTKCVMCVKFRLSMPHYEAEQLLSHVLAKIVIRESRNGLAGRANQTWTGHLDH